MTGAGGIGCCYATRLMKAGHPVVFVARDEHLKALQSQGLSLHHTELIMRLLQHASGQLD